MADNTTLMTSDDSSISKQTNAAMYGLYLTADDGSISLVLQPDSFISYSYSNESRLSQYPQEAGGFQQYNKVDTPFNLRIRVTKGGSVSDVATFIKTAEALAHATDLNLYTLITPERQYLSVNVEKVSHDHGPGKGANMVTMDINLIEIRQTASAQYTNTTSPTTTGNLSNSQNASASDPKQTGTVQTQSVSTTQTNSVNSALADVFTSAETVVP